MFMRELLMGTVEPKPCEVPRLLWPFTWMQPSILWNLLGLVSVLLHDNLQLYQVGTLEIASAILLEAQYQFKIHDMLNHAFFPFPFPFFVWYVEPLYPMLFSNMGDDSAVFSGRWISPPCSAHLSHDSSSRIFLLPHSRNQVLGHFTKQTCFYTNTTPFTWLKRICLPQVLEQMDVFFFICGENKWTASFNVRSCWILVSSIPRLSTSESFYWSFHFIPINLFLLHLWKETWQKIIKKRPPSIAMFRIYVIYLAAYSLQNPPITSKIFVFCLSSWSSLFWA